MKLTDHEKVVGTIRAHGPRCEGCRKTSTDIMISVQPVGSTDIYDYFLSVQQAANLRYELGTRLDECDDEE